MTVIERFATRVIFPAAVTAAVIWAASFAHGAFSHPVERAASARAPSVEGSGTRLGDAAPSPKPHAVLPNVGAFGTEDDGPADAERAAHARPPISAGVRRNLPGSDRRDGVKPYLIPFETGPPAA